MSEPEIPHIIAGQAAVLARRYATALYEMADSAKQLDVVTADMRTLRILLKDNAEFQKVCTNPRLTRQQLMTMAQEVAAMAKVGTLATSFLALLGKNRRLTILSDAIAVFLFEVHKRHGEKTAEVMSARALTAEQQETLAVNLGKLTGSKINIIVTEDASLLGGIVVKVGSKMIDASLKGKLARIERQLKTQDGAAAA